MKKNYLTLIKSIYLLHTQVLSIMKDSKDKSLWKGNFDTITSFYDTQKGMISPIRVRNRLL